MEFHKASSNRNWTYESSAYERLVAHEYAKRTPQTQEEKIAWIASNIYHGEEGDFGLPGVEKAWSLETIYPGSKYLFEPSSPEGQCGITNFGLGMVLVWSEVVDPDKVFYEEGTLYGADGKLSDHHAWVRVEGDNGESWRIDLTAHQYGDINPDPDGHIRIAVQAEPPYVTGDYPGVNYRCIAPPDRHTSGAPMLIPVPNALTLEYDAEVSTRLVDYDVSNFAGRLERFMGRMQLETYNTLGGAIDDGAGIRLDNFWYPENWDFYQEAHAMEFNEFEAREAVSHLTDPEEQLQQNVEIYKELIKESIFQVNDERVLYDWMKDCVEHLAPYYASVYPNNTVLYDILAWNEQEDVAWKDPKKLNIAISNAVKLAEDENQGAAAQIVWAARDLVNFQNNTIFGFTDQVIRAISKLQPDPRMALAELQWVQIRLQERVIEYL